MAHDIRNLLGNHAARSTQPCGTTQQMTKGDRNNIYTHRLMKGEVTGGRSADTDRENKKMFLMYKLDTERQNNKYRDMTEGTEWVHKRELTNLSAT